MHAGGKVLADPCYSSTHVYLWPTVYHSSAQSALLEEMKCLYSDNVLLQTLAVMITLLPCVMFTSSPLTILLTYLRCEGTVLNKVRALTYFVIVSIIAYLILIVSWFYYVLLYFQWLIRRYKLRMDG